MMREAMGLDPNIFDIIFTEYRTKNLLGLMLSNGFPHLGWGWG